MPSSPRPRPAARPARGASRPAGADAGAKAGAAGGEVVAPRNSYTRIYAAVRRIPPGRVATYGEIATRVGLPGQARVVGYALSALAGSTSVPWHRVINAQGRVSARGDGAGSSVTQRLLLEREGVRFDAGGRTSLEQYGWPARRGAARRPRRAADGG
jgi:methylated-DNA-protein-cysteine methyltransferase-like protein